MSHQKKEDSQQNQHHPNSNSSQDDENEEGRNFHQGRWTDEQNLKYTVFMDFHKNIFISKQKRKSIKIFKLLSDYIQTRSPRQCRSHFQKIINKYQTISKFRSQMRKNTGKNIYDRAFQNYTENVRIASFEIKNDLFYEKVSPVTPREVAVQTDINFSMFSQGSNSAILPKAEKTETVPGYFPIFFWNLSEGPQF